jgi:uncharacterized FAD-dependent dehydrogenase
MKTLPSEIAVDVGLDEASDATAIRRRVSRQLGVREADLPAIEVSRRAVDARRGRVRFHLTIAVDPPPRAPELGLPAPREVSRPRDVLVVGDGPAGLFCAYELARAGVGCTVLDRGKPVQPRRRDLKGLNRHGRVDPDSNYCFGEGGAGTYSDGKLYTRSQKRGNVRAVTETLVRHGAPPAVLVDARPHIGSNRLPKVVSSLRAELESVGVRFRFGARVEELLATGAGADRRVAGVRLAGGEELGARRVVLATGHSAADVYEMLGRLGVQLEPKAFAVGVRIEHPQPLIDSIQYGRDAGHPALPPAAYGIAHTVEERGVFSFCMCPGGWIVPASTDSEGLVVNGMSLSKRNSPYANSGLVVSVEPGDLVAAGFEGARGGLALQRRIEAAAMSAGGGGLVAPATRVTDFLAGRASSTLPGSSYIPGLLAADVAEILSGVPLGLAERLRAALGAFGRKMPGYVTEAAVLVAAETRTSSPVRVVREAETLSAVGLSGLYPVGEGAGYAGGIMSAALDGVRVAQRILREVSAG